MVTYPNTTDHCQPLEVCKDASVEALYCEPAFILCEGFCTCGQSDRSVPRDSCDACLQSKACIDLAIVDDEPATDNGIAGLVITALAIRGRAERPEPELCQPGVQTCGDNGGWWADSFSNRPIGSTLWTLEGRSMRNADGTDAANQIRLEAEEMIRNALQPLIDDGLIARIAMETEVDRCGTLCVRSLDIYRPGLAEPTRMDVRCLWPAV